VSEPGGRRKVAGFREMQRWGLPGGADQPQVMFIMFQKQPLCQQVI
jgi:hypothetical protein